MPRILVLYATPSDPIAFDRYYCETHVELAKKLPGLLKYEYSFDPVVSPTGPSGIHSIATLHFADMPTLHAALAGPEGVAAAADAASIMAPGSQILIFDTKEL